MSLGPTVHYSKEILGGLLIADFGRLVKMVIYLHLDDYSCLYSEI